MVRVTVATMTSQGWEATKRPWIRKSLDSMMNCVLQSLTVNDKSEEEKTIVKQDYRQNYDYSFTHNIAIS